MPGLIFEIADVRAERYAAVPTLMFRLRVQEPSGAPVHAIMLRAQLRILPRRRPHTPSEQERLLDLFGEPERWSSTLKPLLWTQTSLLVPAFSGSVEVDLPVACTYDFEVTAAKYLQALDAGEVPLLFLFSGTVFLKSESGFSVEQVPWDKEAACRLPVKTWRELMDAYFPGCGWIRLSRESMDALQRFKARRGLMSWDDTIEALINPIEEPVR